MTKLKEKSEYNLDAAEYLNKKSLYAPSVHCSYYSCFQLLKYTVKYFFGIDYDSQRENANYQKKKSHDYLISYVKNELVNTVGVIEERKFTRDLKDLKTYREESDYDNVEVGCERGETALQKAKILRSYIKKNFL